MIVVDTNMLVRYAARIDRADEGSPTCNAAFVGLRKKTLSQIYRAKNNNMLKIN